MTGTASSINRRAALQTSLATGALAMAFGSRAVAADEATPAASTSSHSMTVETLTLAGAQDVLQAALDTAATLGVPSVVYVVDTAGVTKASGRQDHTPVSSVTFAGSKAITAAAFGIPTDQLVAAVGDDGVMAASLMQDPRVILLGGGVPLFIGSTLVGGIGVSGGTPEQDIEAANAGAAVLMS